MLITNEMTANVNNRDGSGRKSISCGGYVLSHATKTRLGLKRGWRHIRVATLTSSPSNKVATAKFQITSGGVTDIEKDQTQGIQASINNTTE